jgi:MEMO1 family protein
MKVVKSLRIFLFLMIITASTSMGQKVRPIRDNVGFCWKPSEMNALMSYLKSHNKDLNVDSKNLVAGISPHDDYLYAADIYFPLYKVLRAKEVVIFGVTHGTVRKALNDPHNILIFDDYKYWHGPYGNVEISPLREFIKDKLNKNYYTTNDTAQDIEHSIEALVPFLQYYNRDVKITPIMITRMSFERMDSISSNLSKIIAEYVKKKNLKPGKDIFFLISTDANHYGKDFDNAPYGEDKKAHTTGTQVDKRIAKAAFNGILTNDKIGTLAKELWGETKAGKITLWCGQYSVPFGLLATSKIIKETTGKNLKGKILRYSDTWTEGVIPIKHTNMGLTAPFSLKHWVGHISVGFYLN